MLPFSTLSAEADASFIFMVLLSFEKQMGDDMEETHCHNEKDMVDICIIFSFRAVQDFGYTSKEVVETNPIYANRPRFK